MEYKKLLLALLAAALILINPMAVLAAQDNSPYGSTNRNHAMEGSMNNGAQETNNQASMSNAHREAVSKVESATSVFKAFQSNPQDRIPASILRKASAVAIIPGMVEAGLIAGGRYGTGVLLTQNQAKWSAPVFISISGGSLGAQIGVQTTDLVLVFNNRKNVRQLIESGNWSVGAGASVEAGPSGANAKASTSNADVLAYKRTNGLFAGASVSGENISLDKELMQNYYNFKPNTSAHAYYASEQQMAQAILNLGPQRHQEVVQKVPESATQLQKALDWYISKAH